MYQVGEAVIFKGNLWFVIHVCSSSNIDLKNWHNQYELVNSLSEGSLRPATEAEIIAEAVKHGWVKDENGNYDNKTKAVWIFFHPDLKRYVINSDPYEVEDYSIFGQECITAHRLITALNLAKK